MNRSAAATLLWSLALVLASCSLPSGPDEPYYELRPATYWIKQLGVSESWRYSAFFREQPIRRKSIEALMKMGPAAVPACLRALKDGDWRVRTGATLALALYGDGAREAAPALAGAVMDPDPTVRRLAIEALVKTGAAPTSVVPILRQGLSHQDPMIRDSAACAIAGFDPGDEAAFQTLIDGLRYVDVVFRDALQRFPATGRERPEQIMEIQTRTGQRILNHEDEVREDAAHCLGQLGPAAKRSLPHVIAALDSPYADVRGAAADALGKIGLDATGPVAEVGAENERVVSDLQALLKSGDPRVREAAQVALSKLDPNSRAE